MALIYFTKTVMHHYRRDYRPTSEQTGDINSARTAKPDLERVR